MRILGLKVALIATALSACATTPNKRIQLLPAESPVAPKQCFDTVPNKAAYLVEMRQKIFEAGTGESTFRSGKKYSFSFVDANLRDALLELSTASKIPIVFDEVINGTVSVEVEKKPFLDALQMLIASGPYDFRYDGKFFYVGVTESKSEDWQRLAYYHRYRTRNMVPTVALKLLNPIFKNYVTADDTMGVISITAPRRQMMAILESLFDLDVAPRQVLLKMSIAEITDNAFEKLGHNTGNGSVFGALNSLAPVQPAFRSAVLNRETFSDFLSSIDFLAREGKADIRAQPKLIALDGEKAKFESKVSHIIRSDRYFVAGNGKSFIETGVFMTITPNIVSGNEVILNISDARSGDFDVSDESKINENLIATKVRVKEGDTLMIGGMITKKKKIVTSKVPWLGDIPYLGWFFKTQSEENATVEVVFTISPEIMCATN